ncbi:MAG TPA: 4Fe-4S dicluster domain-containing protein [Synergistales bacterium]|nr:4Fe-4S dicluster domain-containing protein [Synergistales bacterium]
MASKFQVIVNSSWCKGCNLCVQICPKKVLELNERQISFPARPDDCTGCRQCENICPDLAITVVEASENQPKEDEKNA